MRRNLDGDMVVTGIPVTPDEAEQREVKFRAPDPVSEERYRILAALGLCSACRGVVEHQRDEPFADCRCGTAEDTGGPGLLQRLLDGEDVLSELKRL
jgi:hypothetical protein